MSDEIHVGDVGTIFQVTINSAGIPVDVSSATLKNIILRNPVGRKITGAASFVNTGADGKIKYSTVAGNINMSGIWNLQVEITMPTGSWKSDISEFKVYENL